MLHLKYFYKVMIINFHDSPNFREQVQKSTSLSNQLSCWAYAMDCLNNEYWKENYTVHIRLENDLVLVTTENVDLMNKLNFIFLQALRKINA